MAGNIFIHSFNLKSRQQEKFQMQEDQGMTSVIYTQSEELRFYNEKKKAQKRSNVSVITLSSDEEEIYIPKESPLLKKLRLESENKKNKIKDDIMCTICLRTLTELKANGTHMKTSLCGHLSCETCVSEYFKKFSNKKKPCPTCKQLIKKREFIKLFL
jgi:hypothetical protein